MVTAKRQKPCGNLRLEEPQQGNSEAGLEWPDEAKRLAHEPFCSHPRDSGFENSGEAGGILGGTLAA